MGNPNEQYQPPSGPPPGWHQRQQQQQPQYDEEFAPPLGPPPGRGPHISFAPSTGHPSNDNETYAPPQGPPPSRSQAAFSSQPPSYQTSSEYSAPPGPPPGKSQQDIYSAPQGPPPGRSQQNAYAPPPGPPPGKSDEPPPYHDWTVIPDTSLLPPPPSVSYDTSPTANASADEGEYAYQWCRQNPLWQPRPLAPAQAQAVHRGEITFIKPAEYSGDIRPDPSRPGTWRCRSALGCRDSSLQTSLPLYSAVADSPAQTGRSKTIYFELHVLGMGDSGTTAQPRSRFDLGHRQEEADAGIAIGFFAPPYPSWRLPGWQRGSLGVHGDDGRRYVNDTFGGMDFTNAFKVGETVGIGITYSVPRMGPQFGLDASVFFTRNGRKDGGWDLHEQLDEKIEGGVKGLEGDFDLFAAVGVFGAAEFEVRFSPEQWVFNPYHSGGEWAR